jgi:hypothetical protein
MKKYITDNLSGNEDERGHKGNVSKEKEKEKIYH